MPWKAVSPIEVYNLLPKTNCKECGEENCMAFAVKLVNLETKLEKCKPLLEESKYRENYEKLREMLRPQVREVELRGSKKTVKIGGEYVMHRHEMTYMNPTAIAIDITDKMPQEEVIKRIEFTENFEYVFIGRKLHLDALAVRSVTNDPEKFKSTVRLVSEHTELPLVICSLNPKVLEAAVSEIPDGRPLLYAATKDNWSKVGEIAKKHDLPLTVFSPGDLDMLVSLVKTLSEMGVEDLALDPGTFVGKRGFSYTVTAFTKLRWKACNEDYRLAGYPLVGTPLTAWKLVDGEPWEKMWWEALTGLTLMTRYADLLIMHSLEGWVYLPMVIWRFNLYTDPRRPVSVDPGLRIIGKPDERSPVFVTGNYALTYSLVGMDMEGAKVNCYLLVVDTEGMAVECAVPGGKFDPENIAELLKQSRLEEMVKHRILVIPGKAARLSGDIEDATGWRVIPGPIDSKDIAKFMRERWRPDVLREILGEEPFLS